MKRFLAFGGSTYYPSGGWHDFRGDFAAQTDAADRLRRAEDDFDWRHIVDTEEAIVVEKFQSTRYRAGWERGA